MSEQLLKFNEQFPNSKYREIHPQYIGATDTEEGLSKYQKSKAPKDTKIHSFEEIKDTKNRIGWIVPKEYIVIDIDKKDSARVVFDVLQGLKIKFSYMTGKKGGHFIFKNSRGVKSISAGQTCSLGFCVDVRCNEKGYIVLPENDTDRNWGTISNEIDDVPFFLIPLKEVKPQDFKGLKEGDGRNDALLKFTLTLIDYAKELSLNEKTESIRLINKYLFDKSLSESELQKTVLRDDILKKQEENDEEEKGCLEERLASRLIKDKSLITANEVCYIYNGKYYRRLSDSELERIIHIEYNSKLKDSRRKEVVKFVKLKSWIPTTELDKKWNEIVFKNCVLNLADRKIYPHTPSTYNTICINANYIADAPYSPLIDEFMNTITQRDISKKTLIYEMIGYCLLKKPIFSKFFIVYGEGQTGKSTLLTMITNLIGVENTATLGFSDLDNQFAPAELYGKLLNIGDDIPYKGLKETDVLKKLVSGERFSAQRKYIQQPLEFSNFATLIYSANKLPEVHDRTSGFYRRVCLIGINKKIENPDPLFLTRLTDNDYEYLLSKAIDALYDAIARNGFTKCAEEEATLLEYQTGQSSVLCFCKDRMYDADYLDLKACMEIFYEYSDYCKNTGFKPLKKVNFDTELCNHFKLTKRNTTAGYKDAKQTWRYKKR